MPTFRSTLLAFLALPLVLTAADTEIKGVITNNSKRKIAFSIHVPYGKKYESKGFFTLQVIDDKANSGGSKKVIIGGDNIYDRFDIPPLSKVSITYNDQPSKLLTRKQTRGHDQRFQFFDDVGYKTNTTLVFRSVKAHPEDTSVKVTYLAGEIRSYMVPDSEIEATEPTAGKPAKVGPITWDDKGNFTIPADYDPKPRGEDEGVFK